jgi:hypothetical protein
MQVLWWFAGMVLVAVSLVLCFAGLTGRQGVLRIGEKAMAERRPEANAQRPLVTISNCCFGHSRDTVGSHGDTPVGRLNR